MLTLLIVILSCSHFEMLAQQNSVDSIGMRSLFVPIKKNMNISCNYIPDVSRRANGKLFFSIKDSFELEFDFFNLKTFAIADTSLTIENTNSNLYGWMLQRDSSTNALSRKIVFEQPQKEYLIFRIKDIYGDFYVLITRLGNQFICIKLFGHLITHEQKLMELDLLYWLNKKT